MISDELLEEIIYISNKRKLIDKKTIIKLTLGVIDNLDEMTKGQFKRVKFVGNRVLGERNFAQCNSDEGFIFINTDKMQSLVQEHSILSTNLQIVETILHEINHLREGYKESRKDIEAFLILNSNNFLDNNDIYKTIQKKELEGKRKQKLLDQLYCKIYQEIYDFIPGERIAEIEAYESLISDLDSFPDFTKNYSKDFAELKMNLFSEYVRVYVRNIIPVVEYFKLINSFDKLSALSFYSPINRVFLENSKKYFKVEDRFKYGLPTDKQDKVLLLSRMR